MTEPGLYVVATPIGNLGDISDRAKDIFQSADYIFAEDTRTTGQLLSRLGLKTGQYVSYTDAASRSSLLQKAKKCVDAIQHDKIVVLVSDAGTPCISDPGDMLVAAVRHAGLKVFSIPGPSAFVAALSIAGQGLQHPLFYGFLPHKKGRRKTILQFKEILSQGLVDSVVLYESPHRLSRLLSELWPECTVLLARELTKKFEEVRVGTPAELMEFSQTIKGELVVILS